MAFASPTATAEKARNDHTCKPTHCPRGKAKLNRAVTDVLWRYVETGKLKRAYRLNAGSQHANPIRAY